MNITHKQFSCALNKLANDHYSASVSPEGIIVEKAELAGSAVSLPFAVIEEYLTAHHSLIKTEDVPVLAKLEKRILSSLDADQTSKVKLLFETIKQNLNQPTSSIEGATKTKEALLRIAPPPIDAETFVQNMALFISYYPRYMLGQHLEVFDTNSFPLPAEWDSQTVKNHLLEASQQFSSTALGDIQALLKQAGDLLRPKKLVKMAIFYEIPNPGNKTVFQTGIDSIKAGIPIVVNQQFIKLYGAEFSDFPETMNCSLYRKRQN